MFYFSLATVDKTLFEGEVVSVTAPGASGEFTVLANHSPLISTLKKGVVKVRATKEGDLKEFEISGGLLETSSNRTIILV
jgi:F-type H+-transporting ATPase subunit epsilon